MGRPLLENKVAIITGSSAGVGASAAKIFAEEGASVIVNYNQTEEGASDVVNNILRNGGKALKVKADICDLDEVQRMHDKALNEFGKIDILVNNAGSHARLKSYRELTEETWYKMLDINLKGMWHCSKVCSEIMLKQKSGSIVNVSSMFNVTGAAENVNFAYASAKAGVIAITKGYARQLAPHVRVNCVGMGVAVTRMSSIMSNERRNHLISSTPLGRLAEPREIANAMLFLASDLASYITGHNLVVDGGRFIC